MQPCVWINGERCEAGERQISARDRGFTLADGVFETMPVQSGVVFRLDRHLERLAHGLCVLGIPLPAELREWIGAAVRETRQAPASLRLTVTRGPGPGGLLPPSDVQPTVVLSLQPLPSFPAAVYENGLTACVASGRRSERAITAGVKTLAYTEAIAASMEACRAGADEALFLDTEGHCSEATASNLFVRTGSALHTPPLSCGALPGVTRAAVMEMAGAFHIPIAEQVITMDDLLAAEEAFLTSSLRQIAPLVRVGGHPIGSGTPGPVTRQLMEAYRELVERESSE